MNKNKDTIFALSTPFGKSALAVIRVSGLNSYKIVKKMSTNMPKKPNVAVFIFTEEDFIKDFSTWNNMLDGLEKIEGGKIPIRGKITQAEIPLSYR